MEASDRNYEKVLGHRLKIVPANDPTAARIGDELVFWILFDGKPLQTNVFATYDGFSRYYNTYAYATESRDSIARVEITHSGAWLVRVERRMAATERTMISTCSKPSWFFPWNSSALKFRFGAETIRL